jgi:uncharacterized protein YpmB
LSSESQALRLAQEKGGIVKVETVEICYMPEPIYRLVIGLDEQGEEKAVWIDTDVRKVVNLKEGIPQSEATQIAKDHGFAEPFYIHLIYQPSEGGKVLWRVTDAPPEAPRNRELWLNFYDGKVIWEWKG